MRLSALQPLNCNRYLGRRQRCPQTPCPARQEGAGQPFLRCNTEPPSGRVNLGGAMPRKSAPRFSLGQFYQAGRLEPLLASRGRVAEGVFGSLVCLEKQGEKSSVRKHPGFSECKRPRPSSVAHTEATPFPQGPGPKIAPHT